jgi:hypothetical protein
VLSKNHNVVETAAQFLKGGAVAPKDVVGQAVLRRHEENSADREGGLSGLVSSVQAGLPAGQLVQIVAVGMTHLLLDCIGHRCGLLRLLGVFIRSA